jgi:hypothetical protein
MALVKHLGTDEIEVLHDNAWFVFGPGATVEIPDELAHGRDPIVDADGETVGCALAGLLVRPDFELAQPGKE